MGDRELQGEEKTGVPPSSARAVAQHQGCGGEDHRQPWRTIAEPQTVGQGEFEPEEANRDHLKRVSLKTHGVQKKFQRTENNRHGFCL